MNRLDYAVCFKNCYTASVAFKCKKCSKNQRIWGIAIAVVLGVFVVSCLSGEVGSSGRSIADRVIRGVPLQAVKIIIVA